MLPHRLPFHRVVVGSNRGHVDLEGVGRQPSLQPLLQEGQHDFDRASPGVFSREEKSTTRSGTRHEVFRGLDVGAIRCPVSESVDPSSEESAREGLSRGASALGTKSGWASMAPRAGSAPLPP